MKFGIKKIQIYGQQKSLIFVWKTIQNIYRSWAFRHAECDVWAKIYTINVTITIWMVLFGIGSLGCFSYLHIHIAQYTRNFEHKQPICYEMKLPNATLSFMIKKNSGCTASYAPSQINKIYTPIDSFRWAEHEYATFFCRTHVWREL